MNLIDIFIPGEPVGKGRPRFSRKNGVAFTPAKTRSYEGIVRHFAIEAMQGNSPVDVPIGMALIIRVAVPPSWPAWKQELALSGRISPSTRPDCDNVEKAVKDAMNQVVFKDDSQIICGSYNKMYGTDPGVHVRIWGTNTYPCQITKRPHG